MRADTVRRALATLPATREEMAERLGIVRSRANAQARYLLRQRYAEEWGSRLSKNGELLPVLQPTGKVPGPGD